MNNDLPVLVAVGQTVERQLDPANLPNPLSLAVAAAKGAVVDAGVAKLGAQIDTVAFVRIMSDSIEGRSGPFGRCDNYPRAVASALGADPKHAIYSVVGGQTPQQLVNEMAARIARRDASVVLLTGAEAIGAMKVAQRQQLTPDWSSSQAGELEDRGNGPNLITPAEIAGGMGNPPQVYGAFEHAWRHANGLDQAQLQAHMAGLFSKFADVAVTNPYAQFPTARTVEFLSNASDANYAVADPYFKWHVAQDAVNQGAAIIMTSVGNAKALGIPQEKWVYPLGGADCQDKLVSRRPALHESAAMTAATQGALNNANLSVADVEHLDLYSCFPCAVQFACDSLGIDSKTRQLTQTGGLPFFGGAGNNYSMHGIASMVETLRSDPKSTGLVLANGGFLSKESVGLYSTQPNSSWQPVNNQAVQAQIDQVDDVPQANEPKAGVVESYSTVCVKAKPLFAYVFARNEQGRFLARTDTNDIAAVEALLSGDPLGRTVSVESTPKRNRLLV